MEDGFLSTKYKNQYEWLEGGYKKEEVQEAEDHQNKVKPLE
jgi:hypothetical protein